MLRIHYRPRLGTVLVVGVLYYLLLELSGPILFGKGPADDEIITFLIIEAPSAAILNPFNKKKLLRSLGNDPQKTNRRGLRLSEGEGEKMEAISHSRRFPFPISSKNLHTFTDVEKKKQKNGAKDEGRHLNNFDELKN